MNNNTTDMMTLEQAKQFTRELNELLSKHKVSDLAGDYEGEIYISADSINYSLGYVRDDKQFNIDSIY